MFAAPGAPRSANASRDREARDIVSDIVSYCQIVQPPVRARFPLAGAGITEFTPWSVAEAAGDLATIRRILGALTG